MSKKKHRQYIPLGNMHKVERDNNSYNPNTKHILWT